MLLTVDGGRKAGESSGWYTQKLVLTEKLRETTNCSGNFDDINI